MENSVLKIEIGLLLMFLLGMTGTISVAAEKNVVSEDWTGGNVAIFSDFSYNITESTDGMAEVVRFEEHLWDADSIVAGVSGIRSIDKDFFLVDSIGRLWLKVSDVTFSDHRSPSALGRWGTPTKVVLTATLDDFTAVYPEDIAGLMIYQDDDNNIVLGKSLDADGYDCVKLVVTGDGRVIHSSTTILYSQFSKVKLKIETDRKGRYVCSAAEDDNPYRFVGIPVRACNVDGHNADNLTGTMLGVYVAAKKSR